MEDAQPASPPVPVERKHQIRMVEARENGGPMHNGTMHSEQDLSTTTLSTIAVRAGDHASMVVALLKSMGFVEVRIDEMRPGLLEIGESASETANLLSIHDDLLKRLAEKDDQVAALLTRTDNLSSEKDEKEAIVYGDMAKGLREAWSGLQKQLMLRGYLLRETLTFHRLGDHHEKLVNSITQSFKAAHQTQNGYDSSLSKKTDAMMNELIDTTAQAMDVGSSVITQIRTLGPTSDNPDRDQEMLASCVLIEKIMLRIASEWERIEAMWKKGRTEVVGTTTTEELLIIEQWLKHAERRVKAVNETGFKILLEEGNGHKARLVELGSSNGVEDGARITHLSGRIEEFLHYVKTRMNRSQRIQAFFQSAQTMLSQLAMMEEDMRNANAAMAGELYPLAQQKATTVIQEGRDISAKEILTYEEQALVRQRCEEMDKKLKLLEELATEIQNSTQISQELASLQTWYGMRVIPFLATHADMGGTLNEAVDFLEAHQRFVDEVVNRDASVTSAMSKRSEMTGVERKAMSEFEAHYERLKDVLESRIRIGGAFVRMHKFAKDLESSFDGITSLLDTNRDFTNERVASQVENVFQMIEDTMTQEKHEVERFVASAEAVARDDDTLDVTRSTQAARNVLVDHDHRYVYLKHKWAEWLANKEETKKKVTVIEEIEMWQEETWEIIRLLENTKTTTLQETEGLHRRVKELQQTIDQQTEKLEEARRTTKSEELTRRIEELIKRQREIKERLSQLEKKVETIYESFLEEEIVERVRAPQILTKLKDAQVDEGSRFEFVARIEGEPEPKITWLKDGIDVKSNIDYRQDFVNGVASLVIEETFIEDTATYTVRAENIGGVAESSATLTVKSRSAISSLMEEEKPRFIKQLTNVQIVEGETAVLDCVVVGKPEPEVIWFKEERTVKEDERTHLMFTGDHVSLTIEDAVPSDSGMYTVRAKNVHGETTGFCQLKVIQKKAPPPPPKRTRRPPEAPTFEQTLTTTTVEEGDTAKLEVITKGEPLPEVTWSFQEQPIYQSETMKIEEFLDGTSRLIISPVTTSHTGIYTATAINEIGEARTSALLNVIEKKTVDEHMLQEDTYETITRPKERTEETTRREEMQYTEQQEIPVTTTETKKTEKRWTEEIDEILEQRAPVTTTEEKETKTAETYVKVHEARPAPQPQTTTTERTSSEVFNIAQIREAIPPPPVETTTTERVCTEVLTTGQIHEARPPPKVETTTTEHVTTEVYNVGTYYEAVPPPEEKKKHMATTTTKAETLYSAKVQPTPQAPEVHVATKTTDIVEREHAATIRRTPVPETHKATLLGAYSLENIAAIQQPITPETHRATVSRGASLENIAAYRHSPAPELHRPSITREKSLERVAAYRQSPAPETFRPSITPGVSLENVGTIRETPIPDVRRSSITRGASLERVGTIHETPIPEVRRSSVTRGASLERVGTIGTTSLPESHRATVTSTAVENAAAIRKTPIPETGRASVTRGSSVENVGTIGTTAVPESHHATVTSKAVENAAAIRQTEPVTPQTARKSPGVMKENVAQINVPPAPPEKREFTKSSLSIERIDDIVIPERVPKTTAEVSQTITDEYRVFHIDEHYEPQQITTTERTVHGGVTYEEGGKKEEEKRVTIVEDKETEEEHRKRLLIEQLEQEEKELIEKIPKVLKEVTQETSTEGWVQRTAEVAKPKTVQTTKRVEEQVIEARRLEATQPEVKTVTTTKTTEEEEARRLAETTTGGVQTVTTTKTTEDEEATRRLAQSRIPQLTKRVTTTTTSDGFVQHVHDELAQPSQVTTTTRKEDEDAQWKRTVAMKPAQPVTEKTTTTTTTSTIVQTGATRPVQTETTKVEERKEEVDESRYRDSFIAASEGEGFWTDGAYTTSPSPPPVPRHRFLEEHVTREELDIGKAATAPEFIRPLHKEYTVDEGGRIILETVLVGSPRPKVKFLFNEKEVRKESTLCEILAINDTYSFVIDKARLEHAGFYKITAENSKGSTETLTMLHVRPKALIKHPQKNGYLASTAQKITDKPPSEHTTVTEEFAMFEYEQRRPQKHETTRLVTPPPAKRFQQAHRQEEEMLQRYDIEQQQKTAGHPPHFTQTLVSAVAADGDTARFEGIVTGWPAPTVEWTKDGIPITRSSLPDLDISNIGGRVSLLFKKCTTLHSGKYMCTARNTSGVATSSAQLVIRPRTIAPDFIQRLISEEVVEGERLKWTVRVTGDPQPKVTWMRDGIEIPDCEEVRILDEGNGVHSLVIVRTEMADSGQFTCLAENVAGEARSTADLVVRPPGSGPGSYFHITKVTQEKQVEGEQQVRNTAFTIENPPIQSAML
ncbi:hypothetical protein V3C99_015582 [Haemonchus contortus]